MPAHLPVVLPDVQFEIAHLDKNLSKFDLCLQVEPQSDGLFCWVDYKTHLFEAATVTHLLQSFHLILTAMVNDLNQHKKRVKLTPEKQALLENRLRIAADFLKQRDNY